MSKFTRAMAKGQGFPKLTGKFIVDTYRGQMRVRSWPRKRGKSKSQKVRNQNDWWKSAVALAKRVAPSQQKIAIEAVKQTGLYPRDVLLNAMSGGIFEPIRQDGQIIRMRKPFLEDVVFQGAILNLDSVKTLPVGVYTTIIWPLPVLDTAGLWSIANPERLTIPAGVNVVRIEAGWHKSNLVQTGTVVPAIRKNGVWISRFPHRSEGWPGGNVVSGARVVEEGDYFDFQIFVEDASETGEFQECFFSLQILDTADGGP
jgi:hypothetical protein